MNRYKEYFIGGPLDGKDKAAEFPKVPEWGIVEAIEFTGEETVTYGNIDPVSLGTRWQYRQDSFTFGGIRVPFWTDHRYMSRELITCRLAELILDPHIDTRPMPCVCTDSVYSSTGWCPSKTDSEYNMCPRRRLTEAEIISQQDKNNPPDEKTEMETPA